MGTGTFKFPAAFVLLKSWPNQKHPDASLCGGSDAEPRRSAREAAVRQGCWGLRGTVLGTHHRVSAGRGGRVCRTLPREIEEVRVPAPPCSHARLVGLLGAAPSHVPSQEGGGRFSGPQGGAAWSARSWISVTPSWGHRCPPGAGGGREDAPPEPQEGAQPCRFALRRLASGWPENRFRLFEAPVSGAWSWPPQRAHTHQQQEARWLEWLVSKHGGEDAGHAGQENRATDLFRSVCVGGLARPPALSRGRGRWKGADLWLRGRPGTGRLLRGLQVLNAGVEQHGPARARTGTANNGSGQLVFGKTMFRIEPQAELMSWGSSGAASQILPHLPMGLSPQKQGVSMLSPLRQAGGLLWTRPLWSSGCRGSLAGKELRGCRPFCSVTPSEQSSLTFLSKAVPVTACPITVLVGWAVPGL